tara:strand:- start:16 stop:237 length:222 start_codon:yes stop_codon:yes gene_type:complete
MKILFRKILTLPIVIYQLSISPFLPASCRFTPTCSDYAKEAIIKFGAVKGFFLAVRRFSACHPWGRRGHDPVP